MSHQAQRNVLALDAVNQAVTRLTCHAHDATRLLVDTLDAVRPTMRARLATQLMDLEQSSGTTFLEALDALQRMPAHPATMELHMMAVDLENLIEETCASAIRVTTADLSTLTAGTRVMAWALCRAVDHLGLSWAARQAGRTARSRWHAQSVVKLAEDARRHLISLIADLLETQPAAETLAQQRELLEGMGRGMDLAHDVVSPLPRSA